MTTNRIMLFSVINIIFRLYIYIHTSKKGVFVYYLAINYEIINMYLREFSLLIKKL